MISLLLAACVAGISNTVEFNSMKPIGQGVLFPEIHKGMLILDTNVFVFDSNINVLTLRGGVGTGHFYPITDSELDIGPLSSRSKIITKIHGLWYVKLNLVIGILIGAAFGSWLGIRSGFKKGKL